MSSKSPERPQNIPRPLIPERARIDLILDGWKSKILVDGKLLKGAHRLALEIVPNELPVLFIECYWPWPEPNHKVTLSGTFIPKTQEEEPIQFGVEHEDTGNTPRG